MIRHLKTKICQIIFVVCMHAFLCVCTPSESVCSKGERSSLLPSFHVLTSISTLSEFYKRNILCTYTSNSRVILLLVKVQKFCVVDSISTFFMILHCSTLPQKEVVECLNTL